MWALLFTTILTSAADSLNPFAIAQQFVLQGMVKKPRHIWYFIIPTGLTNLIGGYFAYFGLIALISSMLAKLMQAYGQMLFTMELIAGVAFFVAAGALMQKGKINHLKAQLEALKGEGIDAKSHKDGVARKIRGVSPLALVLMGIGATISELTTALPYFAFLAILFTYQLTFFQVTLILVLYNTIYTLPLIVLYFIYIKAQDRFDSLYKMATKFIEKWSALLAPVLCGGIGAVLVYHGVSMLAK